MRKKTALTSFLLCIAFLLIYFLFNGYYPFGTRSVAWCNMEQQYIPLLLELKDGSLLSRSGGGMSFWGVFFFFLSSPLSLTVFLTKAENIVYLVNILTVVKFGLCGLTFSMYLKYDNQKISPLINIILSAMYAFSGYNIMYYQNNMWLDIVYMFPVFMIAFRELIKNGKTVPYIICLCIIIVLNYYISYMIILFILFSSFFLLLDECPKNNRRENSLKFMISSFISALITSPVWLVSFLQVIQSGRLGQENNEKITGFFENWIDKYCLLSSVSIVIFSIVVMFKESNFFRHGIMRFYKQIMLVLLAGAFIDPVNKMWHIGSYDLYPLRYGFIIIFIALAAAGKYISEMSDEKAEKDKRIIFICCGFALIYALAVILLNTENINIYISSLNIKGRNAVIIIALGIIALTVNTFFIYSFKQRQISLKFLSAVMSFVFIFETVFSLNIYMKNAPDVTARYKSTMELSNKISSNSFFRVKSQKRYFYPNMISGMGYDTTSHYTSLTNRDFINAMKRMGYSSYQTDVSSNGGTMITDAFLMNKYIISIIGDFVGKGVYSSVNPLKVYMNDDILNGAFISDVLPESFGEYSTCDRMDFSRLMCSRILNEDNIISESEDFTFENIECEYSDGKYKFHRISENQPSSITYSVYAEGGRTLYFDIFGDYSVNSAENYYNCCDVYIDGELFEESYPSTKMNGILNLGQFRNKNVEIKIDIRKDFEAEKFGLYLFDTYKFQNALQSVNTAVIEKNRNKITIKGNGEGYLYIPFAYDKGYNITLNGKKCKAVRCLDSFMAVKLDGGDFELSLKFYPYGIILSLFLSLLGIALMIVFLKYSDKLVRCEKLAESAYTLRRFLTFFVAFVIYIGGFVFWIF